MIYTDFKVSDPRPNDWFVVYGYRPESADLIRSQGELFAVLRLSTAVPFDLANLGGLLFDDLQERYFSEVAKMDLSHFEKAVKGLRNRLEQLIGHEEILAEHGVDLEMSVLGIANGVAYMAIMGESHIFAFREDEFAEISSVLVDPDLDGFMLTGSMPLEKEDKLLICTNSIVLQNKELDLKAEVAEFSLEQVDYDMGAMLLIGYELNPDWVVMKNQEKEELARQKEAELSQQQQAQIPVAIEPELVEDESVANELDIEDEWDLNRTDELDRGEDSAIDLHLVDESSTQPDFELDVVEEDIHQDLADVVSQSPKPKLELKPISNGLAQRRMPEFRIPDSVKHRFSQLQKPDLQKLVRPEVWKAGVTKVRPALTKAGQASRNFATTAQVNFRRIQWREIWQRIGDFLNYATFVLGNLYDRIRGRKSRRIYVPGRPNPDQWKILAVLAVIIVVALGFGIQRFIADTQQKQKVEDLRREANTLVSRINTLQGEATSAGVNNNIQKKEEILNSLAAVETDLSELKRDELAAAELRSTFDNIQKEINRIEDVVGNAKPFTQAQIVTDIGADFQGAEPAGLTISGGNIYVIDQAKGSIYRVATAINSVAAIFGGGFEEPYLITPDENGDLVIVDKTESSTVATYDIEGRTTKRHPGLSEDKVGILGAIDVWNNNKSLYAISLPEQAIVRQANLGGNYQLPNFNSSWLKNAEMANAKDVKVDVSLYVLLEGVGVKRYLSSRAANLTLNGLVAKDREAIKSADAMDLTSTHLFLADSANKRILVFRKNVDNANVFDLESQVVYRGNGNAMTNIKDIVVNGRQIFVLDGARILRLDF